MQFGAEQPDFVTKNVHKLDTDGVFCTEGITFVMGIVGVWSHISTQNLCNYVLFGKVINKKGKLMKYLFSIAIMFSSVAAFADIVSVNDAIRAFEQSTAIPNILELYTVTDDRSIWLGKNHVDSLFQIRIEKAVQAKLLY